MKNGWIARGMVVVGLQNFTLIHESARPLLTFCFCYAKGERCSSVGKPKVFKIRNWINIWLEGMVCEYKIVLLGVYKIMFDSHTEIRINIQQNSVSSSLPNIDEHSTK